MTQQNLDFEELQELKNQFNLLNEKLEKQRIINEEMIKESMKEKLSHIDRWYQSRFRLNTIPALIICIVFLIRYFNEGFGYWGYCLLILVVGLVDLYLDRKAYHALDIKNLPNLSMTEATEKIVKHKHIRSLANKIIVLPMAILIVWTILIACNYDWNLPILTAILFMMSISISWGFYQMKKNKKRLEEIFEQIKKLRE